MIGSDEELRETEDRNSAEPAQDEEALARQQSDTGKPDERLVDVAPARPEDVARKILREALKSFPIPGKK